MGKGLLDMEVLQVGDVQVRSPDMTYLCRAGAGTQPWELRRQIRYSEPVDVDDPDLRRTGYPAVMPGYLKAEIQCEGVVLSVHILHIKHSVREIHYKRSGRI